MAGSVVIKQTQRIVAIEEKKKSMNHACVDQK
jgi:hypothetical protein